MNDNQVTSYNCILKTSGWAMAQGDDSKPVSLIAVHCLPLFKRETLLAATLDPTSQAPESRQYSSTVGKGLGDRECSTTNVKKPLEEEVSEAQAAKLP